MITSQQYTLHRLTWLTKSAWSTLNLNFTSQQIFTVQADLAEHVSLVTTQFEFNKLVFVSLLNCVLGKIISRKLLSIVHGGTARTQN
jgi:hypothetical protein